MIMFVVRKELQQELEQNGLPRLSEYVVEQAKRGLDANTIAAHLERAADILRKVNHK